MKDGERRKANRPTYPIEEIYMFFQDSFMVFSLLRISKILIEYVGSVSLMACGVGVLVALFHAPQNLTSPSHHIQSANQNFL